MRELRNNLYPWSPVSPQRCRKTSGCLSVCLWKVFFIRQRHCWTRWILHLNPRETFYEDWIFIFIFLSYTQASVLLYYPTLKTLHNKQYNTSVIRGRWNNYHKFCKTSRCYRLNRWDRISSYNMYKELGRHTGFWENNSNFKQLLYLPVDLQR